ncbi:MAG: hypothetical protein Q9184_003745 [Pyrenodesmia sp. 2 TL-2023]
MDKNQTAAVLTMNDPEDSEEYEDSGEDVVHGIEEDPEEPPDGFEELIDKYGNIIRVKANLPIEVAKQRTDAAIAAVTDSQRRKCAEDYWIDKFKRNVSIRLSRPSIPHIANASHNLSLEEDLVDWTKADQKPVYKHQRVKGKGILEGVGTPIVHQEGPYKGKVTFAVKRQRKGMSKGKAKDD